MLLLNPLGVVRKESKNPARLLASFGAGSCKRGCRRSVFVSLFECLFVFWFEFFDAITQFLDIAESITIWFFSELGYNWLRGGSMKC